MAKLLFNITNGTNNPTKASLGFMLARTAVEEGHEVTVFLNADAVSLIRKPVLESLVGLGTGKLSEHFNILVDAKVPIYVSAISCEIRGVTEKDLEEANSIKVFPKTLLNLSLQSDRTFVYQKFLLTVNNHAKNLNNHRNNYFSLRIALSFLKKNRAWSITW